MNCQLTLLSALLVSLSATPIDRPAPDARKTTELDDGPFHITEPQRVAFEEPLSDVEIIGDPSEMLQPAENVVFRPLFSYRQMQAKRRKYYGSKTSTSRPNQLRRNSEADAAPPYRYVNGGGYIYPYYY